MEDDGGKRNGSGIREPWDPWANEVTKPGVPVPGLVQDTTGQDEPDPVPTVDETHRIAESLDNLALVWKAGAVSLHEIAMELRRVADGRPIALAGRAAIGNAIRGMCAQSDAHADAIHPEGARAAE